MSQPVPGGGHAASAVRDTFSGRGAFIFAAIGSAVGLGNIWRFPYVAYTNGGGAFIIPYLVALLTAGIPLLFLDYVVGHRYRGAPPMAYRRLKRWMEPMGWWQMAICFVIAVYYAVILALAAVYLVLSFTKGWGADPKTFLFAHYWPVADTYAPHFDFVPKMLIPLVIVWLVTTVVLALGVQNGVAGTSMVFLPVLFIMFIWLVITAVRLPGAADGLNAFFTPDWTALGNPTIWIAAYGQIFFSLSVAFGIMVTYSSYLKKNSDLTANGFIVGFANSSVEILAGIGVFASLGFMAHQAGTTVDKVAVPGIGLAFVAFPTIINQAAGGTLIGILFFGSLLIAGFTSHISILEVIIAALRDKTGIKRVPATLAVCLSVGVVSVLLFPTTTGLNLLDVTDAFVNNFGIVGAALFNVIMLAWVLRKLPEFAGHANRYASIRLGRTWFAMVAVVAPVVLGFLWVSQLVTYAREGYGGMPGWFVAVFGWGMSIALVVFALLMSLVPWTAASALRRERTYVDLDEDGVPDVPRDFAHEHGRSDV
ncbi:neurotransmitter:Na+ symporter, NSS family [Raineyella antarctica]|uniref:Transporter n=1 Tax=Raineyella antarctica TaxID=1577474 RepID=A0A1G6HAD5_9ACTN|nr:sodium-dependent transporter [Raineyella antarctica]SDB90396.1 neurotransmitter:Na+ symporter, NSS family [Raineyella antarctica]